MSCEFAQWDGAYVLGALSPDERAEYQQHLAGCAECTKAVQDLAGLPGLMARIPADALEAPPVVEPVPADLLPTLVRKARRVERRRGLVLAGAAVAATVLIAGGAIAVRSMLEDRPPEATPPPAAVTEAAEPMVPIGQEWMSADLALTSVAWGTRLDLTCSYPEIEEEMTGDEGWSYSMVVRRRDGEVEQVASWRGLPGKTMHLTAATAARRADIAYILIRTSGGRPVMRLSS